MKKNLCKKITFLMDMFSARRRIDTLEPWAKHIDVAFSDPRKVSDSLPLARRFAP